MSAKARARALSQLVAILETDSALLRDRPPAAIRLTADQWNSVLRDASPGAAVEHVAGALGLVTEVATAEGASIAAELRPAASAFVASSRKTARMLWQLSAFAPDERCGRLVVLDELAEAMAQALSHAGTWFASGLSGAPPVIPSPHELESWSSDGVPDPVWASFGVAANELIDRNGQISDARLLAEYRDRLPELTDTCQRLLHSITRSATDPFTVLAPLLRQLRVERPLLAWLAASQALAVIREAAAAGQVDVFDVFDQLRRRSASRAASRDRLNAARETVRTGATESSRALAQLSAYRIVLEGQIRPWGWMLLRLEGASGDLPMVGELRDRLAAGGPPLHALIADAIVPAMRNADAHEEGHFDELSGQLVVADEHVPPSLLRAANEKLAAIDAGLDLALACATVQVEPVAEAYMLRPGDPRSATEALKIAEQRYGHAGLRVWSLIRDRGTVQVLLDEIEPLRLVNPCCLATIQANEHVAGIARWQIGVRGGEGWVLDLPATVLRENLPVFERAARWFEKIPQETFLPCLTWARLDVELPGAALQAAAWMALNDLQHAIDETEAKPSLDIPEFARRVMNVIGACTATLRVMPTAEAQPLQRALDLTRGIRFALSGLPSSRPLSMMIRDVMRERDRLPVPAVMPTIDRRPLDVAENDL
jgi:hypothetical protein